ASTSPAAILVRTAITSSVLDDGIRLADHRILMAALGQLVADKGSCPHIHDRGRAADPPNAPWRVPMRLVPLGGEADAGARALSSIGKIGIERRRGIVDRAEPHALDRVKQLNLVAPADHHRVL